MTFDRPTGTLTTYQCAQSDVEQLLVLDHEAHVDDRDLNTANDTLPSSWITITIDFNTPLVET